MKKVLAMALWLGLMFGQVTASPAIDFKVKGEWLMNFMGGQTTLLHSTRNAAGRKATPTQEHFAAMQRIRLQLEAIASENLSGTVQIQLGAINWGRASQGAALGTDGTDIRVHQAYLDWAFPTLPIKTRMGLQTLTLPHKAGGPAILNARTASIVSSWKASPNLTVTGLWGRPYNDNYAGHVKDGRTVDASYLDNIDLFALVMAMKFDGINLSPWVMYGIKGKNALWGENSSHDPVLSRLGAAQGSVNYTLYPYPALMNRGRNKYAPSDTSMAYDNMIWAGLPLQISMFDPWNIEFEFDYGYVEGMGRFDAYKGAVTNDNLKRVSTMRQGWLAKGLIEYKLDWGIPGIFGWYSSGDDGNPKNGSERIPSVAGYQRFTSFLGNTPYTLGNYYNNSLDYSGTWGIGLRLKDLSFIKNLRHSATVTWWGGTNSPSMVKYMPTSFAWNNGWRNWDGPYLTTEDGLLEANLVNTYKMYDNLTFYGELGYIANFIDNDTWKKAGARNTSFSKQDMWKIELAILYSF